MTVPTVLKKIIACKRQEVQQRQAQVPVDELQVRAADQSPCRGFVEAIERRVVNRQAAVIAEIKKASPSQGVIRHAFQVIDIAESYAAAGAACLSVLTDIDFFQGADHYLTGARNAVTIPVIRKDFIIDDYQVYEARAIGADCILLIVAALNKPQLHRLHDLAIELGMDVLVEVHNRDELDIALTLPTRLIGINNRDLHTFATQLETTYSLLDAVDTHERIVVTESGIHSPDQVQSMRDKGVDAFLIGEAFMRAPDPGAALTEMFAQQVENIAI
ncbi:MAG: indole-3-glycerol phosphate synthase TrpC [Cellvibrionaceae bacterium]|nr:indole-3-glycerol phosphate synthase TrpC [Cellvibrionaceae bacterium]